MFQCIVEGIGPNYTSTMLYTIKQTESEDVARGLGPWLPVL